MRRGSVGRGETGGGRGRKNITHRSQGCWNADERVVGVKGSIGIEPGKWILVVGGGKHDLERKK